MVITQICKSLRTQVFLKFQHKLQNYGIIESSVVEQFPKLPTIFFLPRNCNTGYKNANNDSVQTQVCRQIRLSAMASSPCFSRHIATITFPFNCLPLMGWSMHCLQATNLMPCFKRHCSTGTRKKSLPSLMNFPEILWPSFFYTFRNWMLATLVITPYFDSEFSIPEFLKGAKQGLVFVSQSLANGDFASLEGLVDAPTLCEVQNNVNTLSLQQRQALSVDLEDIYFTFPYQIGIMFDAFNDDEKKSEQTRFVEITVCYHVFKGLGELRKQGDEPVSFHSSNHNRKDNIMVCNYRYICEYTKGIKGQWVVNVINHFKPSDRMNDT